MFRLGIAESSGNIAAATFTVSNPDGSTLTSGSFSPVHCGGVGCSGYTGTAVLNLGQVPLSGTYTVMVLQKNSAGTGSLTFTASNPVTQTLTAGTAANVQASLQGQGMQLSFTGAAGQYLSLGIVENQYDWIPGATLNVLKPDGSVLTRVC